MVIRKCKQQFLPDSNLNKSAGKMTENKYVISGKGTKGIDASKPRSSGDLIECMRFENQTYGILAKTTCSNNERLVKENTENRGDRFQYSETKTEVSTRNLLAKRALIAVAAIVLLSVGVAITVYFAVYYKSDSETTPEKTVTHSSMSTTSLLRPTSTVDTTPSTEKTHSSTSATSSARPSTLTVTVDTTPSTEKTVQHSSMSTTSLPWPTTTTSTVDTKPSTVSELTTVKSTTKDTVRTPAAETTTVTTSLPTTLPETTELTTVKSTTKDTVCTSAAETNTVTSSMSTTLPETTGWTSWGPWTACSVTCASGVHMRYRECHKVDSLSQDEECIGDYVKQDVCTTPACPVNGKWTLWSSWGNCDVSCGNGVQTRTRTCQKSSDTDLDCVGDTTQEQNCNDWRCPDCSKTCLVGILNDACDTCICESTTIEGRILSTAGNPIHGAVLAADTAPNRELAQTNSTGFFSLTVTCLTSVIIVSRVGFQNKIVELSSTFQVIEMAFEVLPRMTEQPRSKFRLAGEDVVFCCSAVSSPNITYYEWFHDSILLNKSLYKNNGTLLSLHSVKPASSGEYTCRANNPVRAVISAPAKLTVKDNEAEFCKDALQQKKISLPSTCIQPATNKTTYETGYCLSKGCRRDTNKSESCIDNLQSCCVPSQLESKTVNCTDYDLQVIVVKGCSCGSCGASRITVFGNAVGAISGSPLMYGEVWLNGEFVSRTNAFGNFTLSLSNSLDRAILTLKDTYKGEFLDAIKIIDITDSLTGRISITIPMLRSAPPVLIDPSVETVLATDPNSNDSVSDMAQISIPANSFYRKDGTKYSGTVSSRLTHINTTDTGMADVVPGRFQFINEEGSTTNLDSKGVFTLTFEDENGIPLVVDDVIDVSFPERNDWNFTLWKLSEDTGNWEPLASGIETKRRKRRRTRGLIGEIDMSQISSRTWLNIDRPMLYLIENLCFFKIRVYKDEHLSEELIRQSGFRMEFHSIENNILSSYYISTSFPAQTCFPASCRNNMAYIRFFYSAKGLYEDLRDLTAVEPISANFPIIYEILDGNKTFKAKMSSSANGPFYVDEAECQASGTGDNHLRFRTLEAEDGYIVHEVTPELFFGEQLLIIKQQVWYPARHGVYSACFIKLKLDIYKKSSDESETKLTFHVRSQGDLIAEMENFVFGIKEFTVDVSTGNSFQCIEYKCSGELEDTNVIDYTRLKIGLLPPTSYHCYVMDVQSNLRDYIFEDYGQRNEDIYMKDVFDAYAPADYGPSLGIYQKETDNNDREGARKRGREDCMKTRAILNEGAAFRFSCH